MIEFLKNLSSYPVPLLLIIVTNILLIAGFCIGKAVLLKNENAIKFFAVFSVLMTFFFAAYFIGIIWFFVYSIAAGSSFYGIMFLIFLFLPFVIGYFSTYKKIQLYSDIQILTLLISLIAALSLI